MFKFYTTFKFREHITKIPFWMHLMLKIYSRVSNCKRALSLYGSGRWPNEVPFKCLAEGWQCTKWRSSSRCDWLCAALPWTPIWPMKGLIFFPVYKWHFNVYGWTGKEGASERRSESDVKWRALQQPKPLTHSSSRQSRGFSGHRLEFKKKHLRDWCKCDRALGSWSWSSRLTSCEG